YAFATGLVGVFLNLFFLSNYSFLAVLYFQIATYATELTAYLLSSFLLPRWRPKHLYVLGLALSAFVLVDLLAASQIVSNAFVFGALWGTAMGVFWAGNNPMMHDITRSANRTPFVATNGFLSGVVTLVAPVSAGALIQFSGFRRASLPLGLRHNGPPPRGVRRRDLADPRRDRTSDERPE